MHSRKLNQTQHKEEAMLTLIEQYIDDSVLLTQCPLGDFNEILDKSFSK